MADQPPFTVATVNGYGRQAASLIRAASAIGWRVRAQMRDQIGVIAEELRNLPNVVVIEGDLSDPAVLDRLFVDEAGRSVDAAFINTTHWGNEVRIGCSLAEAAARARVRHYVYSSMPDHSRFGRGWEALPFWSAKTAVEDHVLELGLPATFVYAGIYNNNFTSLDYPLFRMRLLDDGSFEWAAPFAEDHLLPWLDAEHDVGPSVIQIMKDGFDRWPNARIPLAFELLTPLQVCESFSRGLGRPVRYVRAPITINCPTPAGYPEHLAILERVLGDGGADYFGPDLEPGCVEKALAVWEGFRSVEEYAREVFPVEESNNGLVWMYEDDDDEDYDDEDDEDDDDDDDGEDDDEYGPHSQRATDHGGPDRMDVVDDDFPGTHPHSHPHHYHQPTGGPQQQGLCQPAAPFATSVPVAAALHGTSATDVLAHRLAESFPGPPRLRQPQVADS